MDLDKFRLRRFVERLVDMGEMEVHDEPVPLTRLSEIIEGTDKGVLFRRAGPEKLEVAAKVAGGRARLAAAFDTTIDELPDVYRCAFMLREIEGLSTAETAECLDIPAETVKTRLHRARGLLRRSLEARLRDGSAAAFQFGSSRCDRVVEAVMARIGRNE